MLWDKLHMSSNEVRVVKDENIDKLLKILLYVIPVVCTIICSAVIRNADGLWKYFTVPACILFFFLYKCYYLPLQEADNVRLRIHGGKLIYTEPEARYIVSLSCVEAIKDESVFFDFRGRGNRGWEHKITLIIQKNHNILRESSNGEEAILYSTDDDPLTLEIMYLDLEHADHEKLCAYLRKAIKR